MRFGFIVHPLSPFQRRLLGVRTLEPRVFFGGAPQRSLAHGVARISLDGIHGKTVEGLLVSISGLPFELLEDQSAGVEALNAAVDVCADWGAQLIGLGAVAAIIGGQGKAAQRYTDIPVTTGNMATAWAAVETLRAVQDVLREKRPITLFGPPGPVANAVLGRLVETGEDVRVFHPAPPAPLRKLVASLSASHYGNAELVDGLQTTSTGGRILIAASSTGGRIKLSTLEPGTIVIDVAEPLDIVYDCPPRRDVCILDGEYVRLPNALEGGLWRQIYGAVTGQRRHIFACFAEPMMLGLSNTVDLTQTGRTVPSANVAAIGRIAAEEGFWVDSLHERGRKVHDTRLKQVIKA